MYYNAKSLPEALEDPVLREFFLVNKGPNKRIREERKTSIINSLKNSLKVAGIYAAGLVLIGAGLSFIPIQNPKDLEEMLPVMNEVVILEHQAQDSIYHKDFERAKGLYEEAIKIIPDNTLGKKYKKNLENSISALGKF